MKNIEKKFELYKNKNKKMTAEKFTHLDWVKPKAIDILKVPVELVDNDKLIYLSQYFHKIQQEYPYDHEIEVATKAIIWKIGAILSLWKCRISWEIMKAANDENSPEALSA